jgi:transcriptional regulator with XRE-family HTH domain
VFGMSASRIGEFLKAARERLGWSREALAYHSGVSWSAIAQIESGRRKDVRLSSLSALAEALGVSVDYLIGTPSIAPQLLEHRVLPYGSDEEFLAGAVPFLSEGVARSQSVLAATTQARIEFLRESLDDPSGRVEFADSVDWYRSPGAALRSYGAFVKQRFDAGATWIRIVGEPVWVGRSAAETHAWMRYESMINLAFASLPATILCPYDVRAVSADVVADAHRTHPQITQGTKNVASHTYREPEDFLLD